MTTRASVESETEEIVGVNLIPVIVNETAEYDIFTFLSGNELKVYTIRDSTYVYVLAFIAAFYEFHENNDTIVQQYRIAMKVILQMRLPLALASTGYYMINTQNLGVMFQILTICFGKTREMEMDLLLSQLHTKNTKSEAVREIEKLILQTANPDINIAIKLMRYKAKWKRNLFSELSLKYSTLDFLNPLNHQKREAAQKLLEAEEELSKQAEEAKRRKTEKRKKNRERHKKAILDRVDIIISPFVEKIPSSLQTFTNRWQKIVRSGLESKMNFMNIMQKCGVSCK